MKAAQGPIGKQIFAAMQQRIDAGEWLAGGRLPSIRELSAHYGVTPLTMNRVIQRLEQEGIVTIVPSRGTYVADRAVADPDAPAALEHDATWQERLLRRDALRPLSFVLNQPVPDGTINLAMGTMSYLATPIESVRRSLRRVAATYTESPVYARDRQGERALRVWLANYLMRDGIATTADDLLIINSTDQAFRLISRAVINPGDAILVETPVDPSMLDEFERSGAQCIGIPVDADGMLLDRVREAIERFQPKLLVTYASGHFASGVTLSLERRRALVEICRDAEMLIVEYDFGNEIYFGSPPPPPLKRWDRGEHVVLVREFSRITMAGYRIGCIAVGGPLMSRLIDLKRRDDLVTSSLAQIALLDYLSSPDFERNLVELRRFYGARRDATVATLEEFMPGEVSWFAPQAGFHLWINLPSGISARELVVDAAAHGVIVTPSDIFSIDGKLDDGLRITFSEVSPEDARTGIQRLAARIRAFLPRLGGDQQQVYDVL